MQAIKKKTTTKQPGKVLEVAVQLQETKGEKYCRN